MFIIIMCYISITIYIINSPVKTIREEREKEDCTTWSHKCVCVSGEEQMLLMWLVGMRCGNTQGCDDIHNTFTLNSFCTIRGLIGHLVPE